MAIDDLSNARLLDAKHRRHQPHGTVQVFRVLADDRDAVRGPVADQELAVAVEDHPARRAQRERPLMIVLRHLEEFLVLHDLQHPEAHREDRENDRNDRLQRRQPDADPPTIFRG